jgi:hypothetical protein
MEEISRFYRQVKQVKIGVDCTCPYSPYGHMEGRTMMLTWQGVTWRTLVGYSLSNHKLTCVTSFMFNLSL